MTHDTPLPPLPPLPMRSVSTQLTDDDLDRLDLFRRSQADLPSRSEIIRQGVRLYLDMQDDPHAMIAGILDGLMAIHGIKTTEAAAIGETCGAA